MNAAWSLAGTAALAGLLGSLATERARAYGLKCAQSWNCAIAPCAVALATQAWLALHGSGGWHTSILIACAAVSAWTDLECGYVFDRVLAVCAALLLAESVWSRHLADDMLGAVLAGAALLVPVACSRGRAMGLGDVKLAATLGLGLGSAGVAAALWFAVISGGAAAAILLAQRRVTLKSEMRFGPFLALGACVAVLRTAW